MMVNIYVTTSSTWHLIMSIHITNRYLFFGVRTANRHGPSNRSSLEFISYRNGMWNRKSLVNMYFVFSDHDKKNICINSYLSRIKREPDFRICRNKGADQHRSNCEAARRLCFRHSDNTNPLHLKSKTPRV